MRKPAVVAIAAVSAVLAGGIMMVTTAGPEEAPGTSAALSTELPARPAVPQQNGRPSDRGRLGANGPGGAADPGGQLGQAHGPGGAADPGGRLGQAHGPGGAADLGGQLGRAHGPGGAADVGGHPGGRLAVDEPGASGAVAVPLASRSARPPRPRIADGPAKPKRIAARPSRPVTRVVVAKRSVAHSAARRNVLSADPRGSVQQKALELVNNTRRRGGCGNLTVDRRLIVAANRHAAEMARRGRFAHEDARGGLAGDRVRDAGYRWSRYGENIAHGQDSVAEVVAGWLRSPAHRENIMDCDLREVGIGLAFAADRTPYWVQDLATPQ